jgi:hypothetical protein
MLKSPSGGSKKLTASGESFGKGRTRAIAGLNLVEIAGWKASF